MTMTGFCQHPSLGSHTFCRTTEQRCTCPCHLDPAPFDAADAAALEGAYVEPDDEDEV